MPEVVPGAKPAIPAPLLYEEKQGMVLLLHPQEPLWTAINRLGLEVATLCDGHHSVEQITARYREIFFGLAERKVRREALPPNSMCP